MQTRRREFLSSSFWAFGGIAALPAMSKALFQEAAQQTTNAPTSNSEWDQWVSNVRREIPATTKSPYFQVAGIAPSPSRVIDRVAERLRFQNQSPADPEISEAMGRIEPDLRAHLAASLGARAEEVALTHSTSEGINIVSWSMAWKDGDEVILSDQEHPANVIPWYNLRDRFGIRILEVSLQSGADLVQQVGNLLSQNTKMVSLSHVSRNNGRAISTQESKTLAQMLRERGVRYHLDGAQGPGCVPTDFGELGCDYYSTCGHKWLLGPKGTGALLVRRAILDETLLSWTGSHSHATMDYEGNYTLKPEASRFEFGTRALATFAGLDEALDWWERLGWDNVFLRMQSLVRIAMDRVDQHPKLKLSSPRQPEQRSGIVCFRLPDGVDSLSLYHRLRNEDGVLASPVRDERDFRLAVHCFNTEDDIHQAFDAIDRAVG